MLYTLSTPLLILLCLVTLREAVAVVCGTGWAGDNCDECPDQYFGTSCQSCSLCQNNAGCVSGITGNCVCSSGFYGLYCEAISLPLAPSELYIDVNADPGSATGSSEAPYAECSALSGFDVSFSVVRFLPGTYAAAGCGSAIALESTSGNAADTIISGSLSLQGASVNLTGLTITQTVYVPPGSSLSIFRSVVDRVYVTGCCMTGQIALAESIVSTIDGPRYVTDYTPIVRVRDSAFPSTGLSVAHFSAEFVNCTFNGNVSAGSYGYQHLATVTFENCRFQNIVADSAVNDHIFTQYGTFGPSIVVMRHSTFVNISGVAISVVGGSFENCHFQDVSGSVFDSHSDISLENVTFANVGSPAIKTAGNAAIVNVSFNDCAEHCCFAKLGSGSVRDTTISDPKQVCGRSVKIFQETTTCGTFKNDPLLSYVGTDCYECPTGTFAVDCISCSVCQNGASCTSGISGACVCATGFIGTYCETVSLIGSLYVDKSADGFVSDGSLQKPFANCSQLSGLDLSSATIVFLPGTHGSAGCESAVSFVSSSGNAADTIISGSLSLQGASVNLTGLTVSQTVYVPPGSSLSIFRSVVDRVYATGCCMTGQIALAESIVSTIDGPRFVTDYIPIVRVRDSAFPSTGLSVAHFSAEFVNCTFNGNVSAGSYGYQHVATVTFENCRFQNIVADSAVNDHIFTQYGTFSPSIVVVRHSTFVNISGVAISVVGGSFENCAFTNIGGKAIVSHSYVSVRNSTFVNIATGDCSIVQSVAGGADLYNVYVPPELGTGYLCGQSVVRHCGPGQTGDHCGQCKAGFFGFLCSTCPCTEYSSCNDGLTGSGNCTCAAGFYGGSCAPCSCAVNERCDDGIAGSGTCICESECTVHVAIGADAGVADGSYDKPYPLITDVPQSDTVKVLFFPGTHTGISLLVSGVKEIASVSGSYSDTIVTDAGSINLQSGGFTVRGLEVDTSKSLTVGGNTVFEDCLLGTVYGPASVTVTVIRSEFQKMNLYYASTSVEVHDTTFSTWNLLQLYVETSAFYNCTFHRKVLVQRSGSQHFLDNCSAYAPIRSHYELYSDYSGIHLFANRTSFANIGTHAIDLAIIDLKDCAFANIEGLAARASESLTLAGTSFTNLKYRCHAVDPSGCVSCVSSQSGVSCQQSAPETSYISLSADIAISNGSLAAPFDSLEHLNFYDVSLVRRVVFFPGMHFNCSKLPNAVEEVSSISGDPSDTSCVDKELRIVDRSLTARGIEFIMDWSISLQTASGQYLFEDCILISMTSVALYNSGSAVFVRTPFWRYGSSASSVLHVHDTVFSISTQLYGTNEIFLYNCSLQATMTQTSGTSVITANSTTFSDITGDAVTASTVNFYDCSFKDISGRAGVVAEYAEVQECTFSGMPEGCVVEDSTGCVVLLCPADTYSAVNNCIACPTGRVSSAGALTISDCMCPTGWDGETCDTCAIGHFGGSCAQCTCLHGTCDQGISGTGTCSCDTGWAGTSCDTCAADYYGDSCSACPCTVHGSCDGGLSGGGTCTCDTGWAGSICNSCDSGYFGASCAECTCLRGTCDAGISGSGVCSCNIGWDGSDCDLCAEGWIGSQCDVCANGFFGLSCAACANCTHGYCDEGRQGSGLCVCDYSWVGALCDRECKYDSMQAAPCTSAVCANDTESAECAAVTEQYCDLNDQDSYCRMLFPSTGFCDFGLETVPCVAQSCVDNPSSTQCLSVITTFCEDPQLIDGTPIELPSGCRAYLPECPFADESGLCVLGVCLPDRSSTACISAVQEFCCANPSDEDCVQFGNAPEVTSVQWDGTLSKISVSFNQRMTISTGHIDCSSLLDSELVSDYSCSWVSSNTLSFTDVDHQFLVTESIAVQECAVFSANGFLAASGSASLALATSGQPVVAVSYPKVVSLCETAEIDASASSGVASGGRFMEYSWSFIGDNAPLATHVEGWSGAIQTVVMAMLPGIDDVMLSDMTIPLRLVVTNFLNVESQPQLFTMQLCAIPLPTVQLYPSHTTMSDSTELSIVASVSFGSECFDSSVPLTFLWFCPLCPDSFSELDITKRELRVPSDFLSIQTYEFILQTSMPDQALNSSVSVQVSPPALSVAIDGGSRRMVSIQSAVTLLAHTQTAGVTWLWKIENSLTSEVYDLTSATDSLTIPSFWDDYSTSPVTAIVTVTDAYDQSVSASVLLTPQFEIDAATVLTLDASRAHRISVSAEVSQGTSQWDRVWSCPEIANLGEEAIAGTSGSTLLLGKSSLQPGIRYEFVFTQSSNGFIIWASVDYTLPTPPSGGYCESDPPSGEAFVTSFKLKCDNWVSERTPLRYRFGYQDYTQNPRFLGSTSSRRKVSRSLPSGNLTVFADIYDSSGHATRFQWYTLVAVPQTKPTAEEVDSAISNANNVGDGSGALSAIRAAMGVDSTPVEEDIQDTIIVGMSNAISTLPTSADSVSEIGSTIRSVSEQSVEFDSDQVGQILGMLDGVIEDSQNVDGVEPETAADFVSTVYNVAPGAELDQRQIGDRVGRSAAAGLRLEPPGGAPVTISTHKVNQTITKRSLADISRERGAPRGSRSSYRIPPSISDRVSETVVLTDVADYSEPPASDFLDRSSYRGSALSVRLLDEQGGSIAVDGVEDGISIEMPQILTSRTSRGRVAFVDYENQKLSTEGVEREATQNGKIRGKSRHLTVFVVEVYQVDPATSLPWWMRALVVVIGSGSVTAAAVWVFVRHRTISDARIVDQELEAARRRPRVKEAWRRAQAPVAAFQMRSEQESDIVSSQIEAQTMDDVPTVSDPTTAAAFKLTPLVLPVEKPSQPIAVKFLPIVAVEPQPQSVDVLSPRTVQAHVQHPIDFLDSAGLPETVIQLPFRHTRPSNVVIRSVEPRG